MSEGFVLYTGRRKDTVYRAWSAANAGRSWHDRAGRNGQDVRAGKPFDWSWFQEQRSQVDRANHLSTCKQFIEKHRKGPSRTAPCPTTSQGLQLHPPRGCCAWARDDPECIYPRDMHLREGGDSEGDD